MNCHFHVGQKVVCVSAEYEFPPEYEVTAPIEMPVVGQIYTVHTIVHDEVNDLVCIRVEDIADQWVPARKNGKVGKGRVYFEHDLFRPLVTRKTDISCFKALLNTTKAPEVA